MMNGMIRYEVLLLLLVVGCVSPDPPRDPVAVLECSSEMLVVEDDLPYLAEDSLLIDSYRQRYSREMEAAVGQAARTMDIDYSGESLLGNFSADALKEIVEQLFEAETDMALINQGALRAPIRQGTVSVGDLYTTYAFDNFLCMIDVRGRDIKTVFSHFGELAHAIAGASLRIEDGVLTEVKIGGKPIEDDRLYRIATIDYIAEGNNNCEALRNAEAMRPSYDLLRDEMVSYVKAHEARGEQLDAQLDERIVIIRPAE